jgi:protein-L-isoaspartate(D-aspartate) O-methyltransferase
MEDMQSTISARTQMTYQQVRAGSVLPGEVLEVIEHLPREAFVPAAWRQAAYADLAIPLGHGQHMLTPTVVGRILQAITLRRTDTVLEIGTGSGYLSACLARLAAQVQSLEIDPQLAAQARENLQAVGIGNVHVDAADAFQWQPAMPSYDVVVITGSLPVYDARFEALLRPTGRLFVAVGTAPVMEAQLVRRLAGGGRDLHSLFETELDPLQNAAAVAQFKF